MRENGSCVRLRSTSGYTIDGHETLQRLLWFERGDGSQFDLDARIRFRFRGLQAGLKPAYTSCSLVSILDLICH